MFSFLCTVNIVRIDDNYRWIATSSNSEVFMQLTSNRVFASEVGCISSFKIYAKKNKIDWYYSK